MAILSMLTFDDQTAGSPVTVMLPWANFGGTTELVASSAAAYHGALGARIDTATSYRQLEYPDTGTTPLVIDMYFNIRNISAFIYLMTIRDGSTSRANWRVNGNGTVAIRDGATVTSTSSLGSALAINTWYRAAWQVTSTGQELRIYEGEAVSPIITLTGAVTSYTHTKVVVGLTAASTDASFDIDTVRIADDWMGLPTFVTRQNNFDDIAETTAITSSNSGEASGDAFDSVAGSVTAQAASRYRGKRGMLAELASSTRSSVEWSVSGSDHFVRMYFKTSATSTTHNARMVWSGTVASSLNGWDIRQIVSTELLSFATRNTTRIILGKNGDGTGALDRNTWYRVEAHISTYPNGSVELRLYETLNNTLLDSGIWNGAIDTATSIRYGLGNGTNVTSSISIDSIGYSDSSWLGEVTVPAAVTLTNSFDSIADATAITEANSGGASGNAFSTTSGIVVAETTASYTGLRGMKASLATSTESYVTWDVSGTTHYVRMYFKTAPETTHNIRIIWSGTAASSTLGWDIRQVVSSELISFAKRNGTRFTLGKNGDGTGALDRNTWYRVEGCVETGTNGSVELRLYEALSGKLLDVGTWDGSIDATTSIRYGVGNGVDITSSIEIDAIGYSNTLWLGGVTPPNGLLKVWDGASWIDRQPRVWDGAGWLAKPVKQWDGTDWKAREIAQWDGIWLRNTAEGGVDGVAVTAANSGGASGVAFTSVSAGTGTLQFSSARSIRGSLSYLIETTTTGGVSFYHTLPPSGSAAMRVYAYFSAYPTSAVQLMRFTTAGGTTLVNMNLVSDGSTGIQNAAGSTIYTSPNNAVPLNTWLRFELVVGGRSTMDGYISGALYVGDSTTPIISYSSSVANVGTAPIARAQYGKITNSGTWAAFYLDEIAVTPGTTDFIGPAAA